jgi:CheY-like chemotaxis protein
MQSPMAPKAMALANTYRIDRLVTDLLMPNVKGIETLRYFSMYIRFIPIVAVTGHTAYLLPARALGVTATIDKTRLIEQLLVVVQHTYWRIAC